MACDTTPESSTKIDVNFKVIDKYKELMVASLGDDSLYERSKNTILQLSKELNMTEKERLDIVAGQITQMTIGITGSAMEVALAYADKEASIGYDLALKEAQASKTLIDAKVSAQNICLAEKETQLKCAQITATVAGSIRDNGVPIAYSDADKCIPTLLKDEGLKYEQALQVNASKYQILADSFRKSGVVQLRIDGDSQVKGMQGDADGHTYTQKRIAERQYVSFEDSKRNHAANSSAQTIGQIISAEGVIDENLSALYVDALTYLTQDAPLIVPPTGANILDDVSIGFNIAGTDSIIVDPEDSGQYLMTAQESPGYITVFANLNTEGSYRLGDRVIFGSDETGYSTSHTLTTEDIAADGVFMQLRSVTHTDEEDNVQEAIYNLSLKTEDVAGNYSDTHRIRLRIIYYTMI